MPGQARKFTDEERAALVRAVLVDGMTQTGAIEAAKAGELIPGHKFNCARGTLQGYLRRAAGDPRELVSPEQVRAQLLSALKREIDAELPKLDGRKKIDYIQVCLRAVNTAQNIEGKGPRKTEPKPAEDDSLRSESLERLRKAARKAGNGNGAATNPAPPPDTQEGEQPGVAPAGGTGEESNATTMGRPAIGHVDGAEPARATPDPASPVAQPVT